MEEYQQTRIVSDFESFALICKPDAVVDSESLDIHWTMDMYIWPPFTLYRIAIVAPQLSYRLGVLFTSHQSYLIQDAPWIGAKITSFPGWYENHSGMFMARRKWCYPIHFVLQLHLFSLRKIRNNDIKNKGLINNSGLLPRDVTEGLIGMKVETPQ